ncbi:MAG: NAD(+) synthase [Acidobacteria bacterium]|nr:MAG: NAD(+) synthase [Acidobacteriota bacterium]
MGKPIKKITCCLAAVNQTPMDWKGNIDRIASAILTAEKQGAHILCTPELSITGYGCEDYFLRRDLPVRALTYAEKLAEVAPDMVVMVGLPIVFEGKNYNAMALLHGGTIRGLVPKTHLAKRGIHYEPRWFSGWELNRLAEYPCQEFDRCDKETIPLGNLTFNLGGYLFGLEICEDAWVEDSLRPCSQVTEKRHAVFNASASHFALDKVQQRDHLIASSSKTFNLDYFYTNLLGCESGRAIYDGEMMVGQYGQIVNRSKRLSLDETVVLTHCVSYEPRETSRAVFLKPSKPEVEPSFQPSTVRSYPNKFEEFTAAASLGLFDYLRKSHSRGFTISLSGGVDSAVCAILAHVTCERMGGLLDAKDHRLDYLGLDDPCRETSQERSTLSAKMITTVYQATRNSSSTTRKAAKILASHLGTRHLELDIDPIVESYQSLISNSIQRPLSWQKDDLVLQNIQARSRGPAVWMLANLSGSLLLTTSNRSEVAVGYATMDGDTCGGLAPIAGVEKTFLRRWLAHLEQNNLTLCDNIPALELINKQDPTAELRPPEKAQTDEKDLMPYEILDALEEALVLRREPIEQVYASLLKEFGHQFHPDLLRDWTRHFTRLFAISQWKRERYAPSFHLDDRSLDPKTWARFPILSGNFQVEIEEWLP